MLSRGGGSIASCLWAVACWLDNPSSPAVKQALMNLILSILVLRALPAENKRHATRTRGRHHACWITTACV